MQTLQTKKGYFMHNVNALLLILLQIALFTGYVTHHSISPGPN